MMQDQRMKSLIRNCSILPSSTIHCPLLSSLLNKCLQQVFKSPTHPPYDSMIKRAVKELNEKSGLTEEDISEFIRRKYDNDLPFDHASILLIHLKKLCMMSGELLYTENGKYVFVDCESEVDDEDEVDDDEEDEEEEEEKEDEDEEEKKED